MKAAEINQFVKETVINEIAIPANAVQIGAFEYAIPVEVEGETRYAKVAIVAAQAKDTKTVKAFDVEVAAQAYIDAVAEAVAKAEAKAIAKAEKEAKAAAKAIKVEVTEEVAE